jgi:Domain of unknown function (DUF4157)/Novel toxin 16
MSERAIAVAIKPAAPVLSQVPSGLLQRQCACGQHTMGEECEGCKRNHSTLQRKSAGGRLATVPPIVSDVLQSPGQPLDPITRAFFETRFRHDFSRVRVHAGTQAAESARAVNAVAYTAGTDVVFGQGLYMPGQGTGLRLIAHELSHVVQQSGQPREAPGMAQAKLTVNEPGDMYEQEADRVADQVMTMPLPPNSKSGTGLPAHEPAPVVQQRAQGPSTGPALQRKLVEHRVTGLLQRDEGPAVHTSRAAAPYEKSSPYAESMYRRAGLLEAANAVRKCREGDCSHVLTEAEAYNAYRTGRLSAGFGDPPAGETKASSQMGFVAAGGLAAPAAETATSVVAKTALERAALQWGTAEVVEGGAAAAPGVAAGTVAIPVALGVYLVIATVDLIGYMNFQVALHRQGYIILPNALGVCIGSCHQPAAPDFQPIDPTVHRPPRPSTGQPPSPFGDVDVEALRRWIESTPTEARRKKQDPTQQPAPQPVPAPRPTPRPKSRKCTDEEVDRLHEAMKKLCDQVRGCNPQTDTCATATAKVSAYYACISARVDLQKNCFSKGDPDYEGHMQQIAQLYAGLRECLAVMTAKCKGL